MRILGLGTNLKHILPDNRRKPQSHSAWECQGAVSGATDGDLSEPNLRTDVATADVSRDIFGGVKDKHWQQEKSIQPIDFASQIDHFKMKTEKANTNAPF